MRSDHSHLALPPRLARLPASGRLGLMVPMIAGALLACGIDPASPPVDTPGGGNGPDTTSVRRVRVVSPNGPRAAVIGATFSFDAARGDSVFEDAVGRGLRYSLELAPGSGLVVDGTRVSGVPTTPGVYLATLTARDADDNVATNAFRIVALTSDLPSPLLPAAPHAYSDGSTGLPAHFFADGPGGRVIANDNTPADNAVTDAGATLGRVLFHDRRLSINDRVSCASCHIQAFAFSDTMRFSIGFAGGSTRRHSMPLVNVRFHQRGRMFWDERAATLEAQVLHPIQDPVEMGVGVLELEAKVAVTPYYPPLFRSAFGSDTVTSDRIARALAQFVRSIVSRRSRFDSAFVGGGPPDFARVFTAQELEGRELFNGSGCSSCHITHAFVIIGPANTGLDAAVTDVGTGGGRFKSPTLRNVAARRRFMHDGRFTSLEQVVDFYNSGIQNSPTLDERLRAAGGAPQRFEFSPSQEAALVAYLRTLTDFEVLTAEKWSDPFRGP